MSGVTNTQFADNKLSSVYGIDGKTNFYPFNDCFVETQEMPSDFENTRLESDSTLYFTGDFYQLKDYSLLIKHGLKISIRKRDAGRSQLGDHLQCCEKRYAEYCTRADRKCC